MTILQNLRVLISAFSLVGKKIARGVSYVLLLCTYLLVFPLFALFARSQIHGRRHGSGSRWVDRTNTLTTLKDARSP